MEISFAASGDHLIERHSYRIVEDLNERFNYLFAFMHENNNTLDRWLAILDEGKELEGKLPDKGDGGLSLESDVRGVILYSRMMKKGVVYVYPEVYRGADKIESEVYEGSTVHFGNSIVNRKEDNKLYFRPEVKKMGYEVGDVFEYRLRVIPFLAAPTEWRSKGKELAMFGA